MKVGIVYLVYRARPFLPDVCLSVARQTYQHDELVFILVDNASSDGSEEWIREHLLTHPDVALPEIVYMRQATNTGFAEGNNIGMRYAESRGCEAVYLLNDDAKLDARAVEEAVKCLTSDEKIGSVQSRLMYWQEPEKVNALGGEVHFLGFGFVKDNGKLVQDVPQTNAEIAYGSGASTLYRMSALQKVGMLDAFLFLYHEDSELGMRLRLAGYRNVLCFNSVAYHNYVFKKSIQKFFWMERNRWLVFLSHLKWGTLALLLPLMIMLEVPLVLFAIKGGWMGEKLRVWRALWSKEVWGYVRAKRVTSRAMRQVSDRELVSVFTGRIEHQETSSFVVDRIGNPILAGLWWLLRRVIIW